MPEAPLTPKSFWQRREGTTGMVVLAALGCAGLWGASIILPWVIGLLASTIAAVALAVGLAAVLAVVTSRRVWTLSSYAFRSAMRALTSLWATIDPIGIMKNYVQDLKDDLGKMDEQIATLSGQMETLHREIEANERGVTEAIALAGRARAAAKQSLYILQARQAGRLKKSNVTLQELFTKMQFLATFLTRMREASQVLVADMEAEVHEQQRQREMILASVSAMRTAQRIVNGDSSKRELFDQAMEYVADDYSKKAGEVRQFMQLSGDVLDRMDLERGVYDEEALELLAKLEQRSATFLLGDAAGATLDLPAPAAATPMPIARTSVRQSN